MNNRQTKNVGQSEQGSAENAEQSKKKEEKKTGAAVPPGLNRWQYGCIKKAAGASTMPFIASPLKAWAAWPDSLQVSLYFLPFLKCLCRWAEQFVRNMDEGKLGSDFKRLRCIYLSWLRLSTKRWTLNNKIKCKKKCRRDIQLDADLRLKVYGYKIPFGCWRI